MISALDALARLREGNRRFAAQVSGSDPYLSHVKRPQLTLEQEPFAIILGCSDARVPAEILFDQGVGDLFVIRVAGNIVAPSQVGSVEFATEAFGTRLVVVLGHTQCGAIKSTITALENPSNPQSRNLRSIVERVRPSVASIFDTPLRDDHAALVKYAVRANVRHSVDHLKHGSEVLENAIARNGLLVVGAEYAIETGEVEFFDLPDENITQVQE